MTIGSIMFIKSFITCLFPNFICELIFGNKYKPIGPLNAPRIVIKLMLIDNTPISILEEPKLEAIITPIDKKSE